MTEGQYNQQEMQLSRVLRPLFPFYLAFVALVTIAYGLLNVRISANWAIGDWLINYRGGFVRRGFMGELSLLLAHALHISPLYIVLLLQLVFYAVIFYVVWQLASVSRWSLWMVLMLLSPATLAFHVLDPTAGFRKEIILFAGLGMLLLCVFHGACNRVVLSACLTLLCVASVLSHEALMVFFPYLLAALWLGLRDVRRVAVIAILPLVATLLAAFAVVRHPGNTQAADAICASIGGAVTTPLSGVCGGAIAGLTVSSESAHSDVVAYIHGFHYFTLYSITGLLAFLPIIVAYITLWREPSLQKDLRIFASAAMVSIAGSTVLFYYATDWGRWIYIHVFCISLLLLALENRRQHGLRVAATEEISTAGRTIKPAVVVFVLVYVLCWDLPHVGLYAGRFGYAGLAEYAANYRTLHHGRQ